MNKLKHDEIVEEINKINEEHLSIIEKNYSALREAYQNPYDWPNLDPLRYEICLCLMYGLNQAAITLTNHFMESLLKNALIAKVSYEQSSENVDKEGALMEMFTKYFKDAIDKYGNASLNDNINNAQNLELITKEQMKQLHIFRNKFRNAYSHSDKKKTFGTLEVPVKPFYLEKDKLISDQKTKAVVAKFPIGQGLIQAFHAKANALNYFLYVDNIARRIYDKLFNSE